MKELYYIHCIQTTEIQSSYFEINKMKYVCLCVDFSALDATTPQVSRLVITQDSDWFLLPYSASSKGED